MITIYTSKDLSDKRKALNISDVEYTDFTQSKDPFIKADFVVYADTEEFIVLKNRLPYPKHGAIFPMEHFESLLVSIINKLQS